MNEAERNRSSLAAAIATYQIDQARAIALKEFNSLSHDMAVEIAKIIAINYNSLSK
ncbi:hypothetical protein QHI69_02665 [Burkholderia gladioli pv. gladioli]|uniref:hypothetical protein n=1 Tax=Burkholderia gladioli TaxID=28095 RepID=UPI00163F0C1C|nr:hypothetical protein [Burkholderia gladioli]MDJ1160804.1 hypothetical protein [Burkholderia gladioli pv. gladioli]